MRHNREKALCCGIAAFAARQNITDILSAAQARVREAEETGADVLVVYYVGCLLILSTAKRISGSKIPIYHLIEIVREATGEKLTRKSEEIAENMYKITMEEAQKYLTTPEKYWIKPIEP
ncbi:MAG: heterodisulfide reductase-related iron-sulfur binding cluster [Candidatus Jordarchaeales archaeon]